MQSYKIIPIRLTNSGPFTLGVELPIDAFMDGVDDPRFPAPDGAEWGEGLIIDGVQFVEVVAIGCTYSGGCAADPCPTCHCETSSGFTCDGHIEAIE